MVLLGVDDLAALLDAGTPPVLLDVRWRLGDDRGRERYREGHIPGAVYVDLDTELAGPPTVADGRHPLPDIAVLQDAARRWGVHQDSTVVVYDDSANLFSARAWWLLRWAGVRAVHLLDGALGAWIAAGHPVRTGDETATTPGTVVLSAADLPVVGADDVAAFRGTLLDARTADRFRGENEPVDARAGHIPGAVSAPTDENVDATGRFLPADRLRARFDALGVEADRPTAVYCGSGVTAAHEIAALEIAGLDAALYPGSFSQWAADPARPVVTDDRSASG